MLKRHIHALPIEPHDFPRGSDNRAVRRNVMIDNHGFGSDVHVVSNFHGSKYCGIGADENVISDGRMPFPRMFACTAESDSVEKHAVISDFRGCADYDSHAM